MKIVIRKADIRREPYRASGPGGQHRNKTETAIRLVHEPTGIVAQSSSERSQSYNYQTAMTMLVSRIVQAERDRQAAERGETYAAKPDASFGNQVRTYWRCGQRRVVDHRTGVEGDPDRVVGRGELDSFIQASLRSAMI